MARVAGWVAIGLCLAGCAATYSTQMRGTLKRVGNRDYAAALARIEKPEGKTNKVLYRLERGLILHYQGEYELSNAEFEKAEKLIDELFTKSASREAAALLTNDAVRAYRGEEFERVMINFYRALNYQSLGLTDDALVECRKANLKLEDYAQAYEGKVAYRNDAFVQYLTGLFYQGAGEWNDAYVSYRNAAKGYASYQTLLGVPMPRMLAIDMARTAARLGFSDDQAELVTQYGLLPEELRPAGGGELVFLGEAGFVARKHQYDITLPIYDSDQPEHIGVTSQRLVDRYHRGDRYHSAPVKYWLRLAMPEYRAVPSRVATIRVICDGQRAQGVLVEDLDAIAQRNLADHQDEILLRTGARALSKYAMAKGVESLFKPDRDEHPSRQEEAAWKGVAALMGSLANLLGAATEAADTRSWLSLPARVYMARVPVAPGTHDVVVEYLDARGQVLEAHAFTGVRVAGTGPVLLSYRSYR